MSVYSVIKSLVAKVNEHSEYIKESDEELTDILDRLDLLEDSFEEGNLETAAEQAPAGEPVPSSSEEDEELKLVE